MSVANGAPALSRLREEISRIKAHDAMASVVLIAPNQLAGTVARRHLARHGREQRGGDRVPGIAGLDVTTIDRFAERLAASLLTPRRPATGPVLATAWRAALADEPGLFGEVADHTATIEALVAAHRELRDLDEHELNALAADGPAVTRDLVRLHLAVAARLAPDWYDTRDLLDTATAGASVVTDPVVLYLPQDLSNPQQRFIAALAEGTDVVAIEPDTDTPSATATRVANASDSDDEIRSAVREVVAALRTTPAERIAVLYTAREPYARLLHEQLTAAGIRVNGPGVRPVVDRAIARTLTEILALGPADMPRADLFRALAGAPVRAPDGDRVPVARWERLSREAGIIGGDDWSTRLEYFIESARQRAAGQEAGSTRAEFATRQADDATALRAFVGHLHGELARGAAEETWAGLSEWALDLLRTLLGADEDLLRLPPEEQHAAAACTRILRGLAVLDDVDGPASLEALIETLHLELEHARPRVGSIGDGVLVAPVSAAVGLDLDLAVVVGLSEGLYPGRPRLDALLPESVRTAVDSLRTARDELKTRHRHLLAAFVAAPDVVASFPRGDLRSSGHRLPSRWLLDTLRELADSSDLAATAWENADYRGRMAQSASFAGELLRTPRPATGSEWRTQAARAGFLHDDVATAAQTLLRARRSPNLTRFDGNLTGVPGLPDHADGEHPIAPTTLENYAGCPHAYFVERLLQVRPIDLPEEIVTITALEIGNIIHQVLDQLITEHLGAGLLPGPGEPWPQAARDRLTAIGQELCQSAEQRGLTGHPRLWENERTRIAADLLALLDADDAWRAERVAHPVASEVAFGTGADDAAPAVEVPVTRPDGTPGRVLLRGSVDMVSRAAGGTVLVTDLKTGRRDAFKPIEAGDPLVAGTKLQLPVYALAARDAVGDGTAGVEAGYWFVRKDPGRIELPLTPDLEQRYAAALSVLVGSIATGLFPQRPPEKDDYAYTQCWYCNPDAVGYGPARGRWEAKQHDPALTDLMSLIAPDGGAA
ncbi:PD-(D/E)XK nuclease family protein [Isoptericola sediminis]